MKRDEYHIKLINENKKCLRQVEQMQEYINKQNMFIKSQRIVIDKLEKEILDLKKGKQDDKGI